MRFKVPFLRYALAGIAFLLPSVALTAVLPFLINAQPIRAKLVREIGSWTGGEVKLAGSVSVQDFFSLSVEAQDVEIGRFKAVPSIEGMKAESIVARIAWFNLLSGNFNFDKVRVQGAVVDVRANGPSDATRLLADLASGSQGAPFDAFVMEDSTIVLHSSDGKAERPLRVTNAIVRTAKSGSRLITSAGIVWKDRRANLATRSFRSMTASRMPFRVSISSDLLDASFDGDAVLASRPDAEGVLKFRSPDLAAAADWLEVDIGPAAVAHAMSASGDFTMAQEQATLTSAEISFAGQTAQAALTLKPGNKAPRLEGVLAFEHFDAMPLLAGRQNGAAKPQATAPFRIPIESDLRVSAKTLTWNGIQAGPAALVVTSKPERLTAEIAELGFLGGEMRGHIALDMTGPLPRATARLTGESLDAAGFLSLTKQRDWLSGEADVNVEAEATFDDPGQLFDRVVAHARVNFPEGGQMRLDIPRLATSALGESSGWNELDLTSAAFDRLRFDMTLQDGQISFGNVVLAAAGRQLSGRGEIDLAGRSLDWQFNFLPAGEPARDGRSARGTGASAAGSHVLIKGPWASPTIRRDGSPSSMLPGGDHAAGLEVSLSGR